MSIWQDIPIKNNLYKTLLRPDMAVNHLQIKSKVLFRGGIQTIEMN